jgi:alpha-1,6-mannosyltransferase
VALIVQAANFVAPRSGGIRTTLDALGAGYLAAGHRRVLLVPGERDAEEATAAGQRVTLRGPPLPSSGGYRVLAGRRRVVRLLERLRPDRLEVSDKLTLRWLGPWARAAGIPAVVVSHERLDRLVDLWLPRSTAAARAAAAWNRRLAASFDRVVCTTRWAAEEFLRLGAGNVDRVPLGVDLEAFAPDRASARLRRRLAPDGGPLLVHAGRLAREKRPELAVDALQGVLERWPRARLVFAGAGPLRLRLSELAAGLPVEFLGFVADRRELAALLATADVVLAPGPVETFGLTALESLASGTPVVAARTGALPELLAPAQEGAGLAVHPCGPAMAAAVATVLAWDPAERRAAARRQATRFPWSATVAGMLEVHRLEGSRDCGGLRPPHAPRPGAPVDREGSG